jgi:uncharacterized protein YgbK (DUF1537 family)
LNGKTVGLVLTGGNIDSRTLLRALRTDTVRQPPHAIPGFPMASLDYGD